MPNWEVTDKRIYQLLKHPYQLDKSVVEDMTFAYLEFVEELFTYLNPSLPHDCIVWHTKHGFTTRYNRAVAVEAVKLLNWQFLINFILFVNGKLFSMDLL